MSKQRNLLKALSLSAALVTVSAPAYAADEGRDKILNLINTMTIINDQLSLSVNLTQGAVGYAEVGGVIVDGALDGAKVTEAMLLAYQNAVDTVLGHDYNTAQTAQELFQQEYAGAMYNLDIAVDTLVDATSVLVAATEVASIAAEADTRPEQVALQGMLQQEEYTIQAEEVTAYNESLDAVGYYAQQAGAFLAASNNNELTASIDSYSQQGNFVVGTYTAITYTQSIDEFVITWGEAGFGTGWQGYLTPDMKSAEDVFGASEYIMQYGQASSEM